MSKNKTLLHRIQDEIVRIRSDKIQDNPTPWLALRNIVINLENLAEEYRYNNSSIKKIISDIEIDLEGLK